MSKMINRKKYALKEKIIYKANYDYQKGLDNDSPFTDDELDEIVEKIINTTDRTERLEPFSSKIIPKYFVLFVSSSFCPLSRKFNFL